MVTFLLGAGFNADAVPEAGQQEAAAYPLARDLLKPCFGRDSLPPGRSVEDLFADALDTHQREPICTLAELLMNADHDVGFHLRHGGQRERNAYLTFLRRFPSANYVTFNYDSLLEILLLSLGRWRPDDGYGIPVRLELAPCVPRLPDRSTTFVLHLHGSLCVCPEEYQLKADPKREIEILVQRGEPLFSFDPDAIVHCFAPYVGASPAGRYQYPDERIIAPVPDKAKGFRQAFVRKMFIAAQRALAETDLLVVIGYRFGTHDQSSFRALFTSNLPPRVLVVSPDADDITTRVAHDFPRSKWTPVCCSFAAWVRRGFPGVR